MDAGRREGRALNGHPGILLFSIWVHCLPPPSALPPLSLLCSCQMLVSLVIKTLGADRGCQAPGICEGWKRRRNKFVFVEWKFVCVRMSPSPASLVAPHLGWTGPGHEQGGSWGSRGRRRHSAGEGSFPVRSAPSHSLHPKTTALCHTLVPAGMRHCFLPPPQTKKPQ